MSSVPPRQPQALGDAGWVGAPHHRNIRFDRRRMPRYRDLVMGQIRVALAEDNALLREGISRIIDGEDDFDLVGKAGDLPSCWRSSRKAHQTLW